MSCIKVSKIDNKLKMIKPAKLHKGDKIGVLSTSSWVDESELIDVKNYIETMGYEVYLHPQAPSQLNQSAGPAVDKVNALHELFEDNEIKAIIGSRGGNRAITMLDKLDFDLIAQNPKIICGYSDLTCLLNSITKNTGLITFHGPLFRELKKREDTDLLFKFYEDGEYNYEFSMAHCLRAGKAQGKLIGGNLSVLQSLCGTPFQPDTRGSILFLEDIGDQISRYDRMIAHLNLAGMFEGLAALMVGSFSDTQDDDDRPFGFSIEEIIKEHTEQYSFPIITNAPFGHEKELPPLPIGHTASLIAQGDNIEFKLVETPLS